MRQAFSWGALLGVLLPVAAIAQGSMPPRPAGAQPAGAALLQLEDGRSGRGNLIATTGIRGFAKPASATAHALILTIGNYQGGIPRLKGVAHDATTAAEIARRLGVPPGNTRVLRDEELTLEGLRRAFDELEEKLGGDDQVFIYYSGHGGRQLVQEEGGERCAESLIAVDGRPLTDSELERRLQRIAAKTQKTIVFLDACHSGGATTRAAAAEAAPFTPKSYNPGASCTKPVNVLTRSLTAPRPAGQGGANFVHIAAARDDEVSLDQPGRGGVASQAWLACLAGAARDSDGSGGLSAQEIQACAQERIDALLRNVPGFLPHHVSVTGNSAMVLTYAAAGGAPAGSASSPASSASASVATQPTALAALLDIYNSRDDRRLVTLQASKPQLKIGVDRLELALTSREGGYVYLLMVGSDGKTFDLLFPNQIDRNHLIEPGATLRLPRPSWQLTAEGPPGKNTLVAIVTDNPRDFSAAGLKPAGPFSIVEAVAAKDIQLVTAGAANPPPADCNEAAGLRTLAVRKRCSTAYGAALLTLEEVR